MCTQKFQFAVVAVMCLLVTLGCGAQPPRPQVVQPTEEERAARLQAEVQSILQRAKELRRECTFVVQLRNAKSSVTLNPFTHMGNEFKAQYRDIIVGESTYNEWQVGEELSRQFDGIEFFFGDETRSYVVSVAKKWIVAEQFFVDRDGASHELSEEQYDAAAQALGSRGTRVSFGGVERIYIGTDDTQIAARSPLERFYAEVEIANSSVTLSIRKHLSNATTKHLLVVEVSERQYNSEGDAWEPEVSHSVVLTGRLSQLSGTMVRRWKETDASLELLTFRDGHTEIRRK